MGGGGGARPAGRWRTMAAARSVRSTPSSSIRRTSQAAQPPAPTTYLDACEKAHPHGHVSPASNSLWMTAANPAGPSSASSSASSAASPASSTSSCRVSSASACDATAVRRTSGRLHASRVSQSSTVVAYPTCFLRTASGAVGSSRTSAP